MAKVKICGIKTIEDVNIINALKPDYVGIVFAKSKRRLDVDTAQHLFSLIDKDIKKVGVFVNQGIDFVSLCREKCALDVIQLHGDEVYDDYKEIDAVIWKAFRIKGSGDFSSISKFEGEYFLTDAYVKGIYGGTGTKIDINEMRTIENKKHIVAGGLTNDNVGEYITTFNPYCVDVSSSVEVDGSKDLNKTKQFIEEVRKYG